MGLRTHGRVHFDDQINGVELTVEYLKYGDEAWTINVLGSSLDDNRQVSVVIYLVNEAENELSNCEHAPGQPESGIYAWCSGSSASLGS